jgi:NADPH2:quinone reductase
MKAWRVAALGEPRDVLRLVEVVDPAPGPGQLLVKVLAAPANFPDVLMCRGEYQVTPELPFTPGVELCGEVVALGVALPGSVWATGCWAARSCRTAGSASWR